MKINEGDIFEFSINDNTTCYGQIIKIPNKESLVVVIFEGLYNSRPLLDEIVKDDILLFGSTFDARIYNGNWKVIGNTKNNLEGIHLPFYKIGIDPAYLESFDGMRIRELCPSEEGKFSYRKYVAPVRFELALKAHYKQTEWNEKYDSLLYKNVIEVIKSLDT